MSCDGGGCILIVKHRTPEDLLQVNTEPIDRVEAKHCIAFARAMELMLNPIYEETR